MFLAEADTIWTGLSGVILGILIAWAAIAIIRRRV